MIEREPGITTVDGAIGLGRRTARRSEFCLSRWSQRPYRWKDEVYTRRRTRPHSNRSIPGWLPKSLCKTAYMCAHSGSFSERTRRIKMSSCWSKKRVTYLQHTVVHYTHTQSSLYRWKKKVYISRRSSYSDRICVSTHP